MTTYHFGTSIVGAQFVELPAVEVLASDGSTIRVSARPVADTVLLVRDPVTLVSLPDVLVDGNGYWSTTAEDIPTIEVSADSGTTWVPQDGREATVASLTAGANAQTALTNSLTAINTANNALAVASSGSGGSGGPEFLTETSAGSYPAPVGGAKRIFIGQVRPTDVQGARAGDLWWNTVVVP